MLLDLQKIGETLREKREEKGLTIVNISDSAMPAQIPSEGD